MRNLLTLFLLGALWSPSFLFIKLGLEGFPPFTVATLRVGIAGFLMWSFLRISGHTLPRTWRVWRHFLLLGVFGNAIPFSLFALGETRADSAPAAILNSTTPIFTVLLAHLFIHDERLERRRVAGVGIGFVGIVVLFLPEMKGGFLRSGQFLGYVAFTMAALCYGITNVYIRRHLRGIPGKVSSTAQLLCATAFLLPVSLIVESPWTARPGLVSVAAIVALAVFGTAVALTFFFELLRRSSATFVSMVTYIIPPGGIVLGAVILDEHIGWNHLAGCALILAGVMVVNGYLIQLFMRAFRSRGTRRNDPSGV